jgi:hypothetical protein
MGKVKWPCRGIVIFGIVEILTGCVTLAAVFSSLWLGRSTKPLEVLIFVLITAATSLGLGIGLLKRNLQSYRVLLFFSAAIILSKVLIFSKIIYLSGALETVIPSSTKNIVSMVYHSLLILFLAQSAVKSQFEKKRCA